MRVRAQQGLSRRAETLQMELVTNAVAGLRENGPVALRHGHQVGMIVGVLEADLDRVVVHVAHRQIGAYPVDPHALELQEGHGSGGVLGERLVDADGDVGARNEFAGNEVGL